MQLAEVYERGRDNTFYVISYEAREGVIELLDFTFATLEQAQEHLCDAEAQGCGLRKPQILTAKLTGVVKLVPTVEPLRR